MYWVTTFYSLKYVETFLDFADVTCTKGATIFATLPFFLESRQLCAQNIFYDWKNQKLLEDFLPTLYCMSVSTTFYTSETLY